MRFIRTSLRRKISRALRVRRSAFGVRARASTFARAPVVERASLARPTLSGVHDRVVATADKLCSCSCVVACRKGVSTQLEPPSRNCTRVAGLGTLTGICLGGRVRRDPSELPSKRRDGFFRRAAFSLPELDRLSARSHVPPCCLKANERYRFVRGSASR